MNDIIYNYDFYYDHFQSLKEIDEINKFYNTTININKNNFNLDNIKKELYKYFINKIEDSIKDYGHTKEKSTDKIIRLTVEINIITAKITNVALSKTIENIIMSAINNYHDDIIELLSILNICFDVTEGDLDEYDNNLDFIKGLVDYLCMIYK